MQALVLKRAAEGAGLKLEKKHLDALLAAGDGQEPKEIVLPRRWRAWVYRGTLRIGPPPTVPSPVLLPAEGTAELPEFGLRLRLVREAGVPPVRPTNPWMAQLDMGALRPPLVVRAARPGERFRPLGLSGRKKVADLLAEAGVPPWARKTWPLLCDAQGVVWVVGIRLSDDHKVTPRTVEVLRVEAERT